MFEFPNPSPRPIRIRLVLQASTMHLPVLLALVSAVLFAFGDQFQNQGLAYMDSRSGAVISILSSTAFFLAIAPWYLDIDNLLHPAVLIFMAVGLFRPGLSINLALAGIRYLGPTLGTTLTSISPLFGALMGVLFLGEAITVEVAVGTGVIILAIMLLTKRGGGIGTDWPYWALLLPIGAAIIRSGGHVLSKIGMNDVPDPYLASLVTFAVSAVVTSMVQSRRKDRPRFVAGNRGTGWFVAAGVLFGLAVLIFNQALLIGTVVQTIPVVSSAPIFTMILSIVVFRREKITPRTVAVVFMVIPAIIVIALAG